MPPDPETLAFAPERLIQDFVSRGLVVLWARRSRHPRRRPRHGLREGEGGGRRQTPRHRNDHSRDPRGRQRTGAWLPLATGWSVGTGPSCRLRTTRRSRAVPTTSIGTRTTTGRTTCASTGTTMPCRSRCCTTPKAVAPRHGPNRRRSLFAVLDVQPRGEPRQLRRRRTTLIFGYQLDGMQRHRRERSRLPLPASRRRDAAHAA